MSTPPSNNVTPRATTAPASSFSDAHLPSKFRPLLSTGTSPTSNQKSTRASPASSKPCNSQQQPSPPTPHVASSSSATAMKTSAVRSPKQLRCSPPASASTASPS